MGLSPITAPLLPLTTVPFYMLFGEARIVAHLANSAYLFLLLVGVVLLGEEIYGRHAGLLAAFVTATCTVIVNHARDYLLELPSTVFLVFGLWALLRTDDFQRRGASLALGALVGLTMLAKTMTVVFFAGPVGAALVRAAVRRPLAASTFANVAAAGAMALLVASVWWGPNFETAMGYLTHFGLGEKSVPYAAAGTEPWTLTNLTFYLIQITNFGASFAYVAAFAVLGLRWAWKRLRAASEGGRAGPADGDLWLWLAAGYAILTLVPNKPSEKFTVALMPVLALLLAGFIERLDGRRTRRIVTALVVAFGAFHYAAMTFEWAGLPRLVTAGPFALLYRGYPHYDWLRETLEFAPGTRWPIAPVLSAVAGPADTADDVARAVLIVPDHPLFNPSTFRYYAERERLPLVFNGAATRPALAEFAFVVVKDGGYQGYDFTNRHNGEIAAEVGRADSGFTPRAGPLPFPDGSRVLVYAARGRP